MKIFHCPILNLFFRDYKEYHTDTTVHFVVSMTEENLAQAEQEGILKKFKLETSIATSSMVRNTYVSFQPG